MPKQTESAMQFWSLPGLVSYETARELQLKLVDERALGKIPDTVLFLEHEPVVTRGRGLQFTGDSARERHVPLAAPLPEGIAWAESERGGDLTYHGPGQLVMYPICKLDGQGFGPHHDIAGFLRKLEQVLIDEFTSWGLEAQARAQATGVWVGTQKVASIGIAVRKWVTYHGVAINAVNDLQPFHWISPCGFNPEVMTSLQALLPEVFTDFLPDAPSKFSVDSQLVGWRARLELQLARRMAGEGARVETPDTSFAEKALVSTATTQAPEQMQ